MLRKKSKQDLPTWLLDWFSRRVPSKEKLWADAMLCELASVRGSWNRLIWALSGCRGLCKIWIRAHFFAAPVDGEEGRPLAVTFIALYHTVFSGVILAVLAWHVPFIKAWTEAFFPLLIAFFVALIPAVISLGLWVLDDSARLVAMFFSLLHALGNCAWISAQHLGWRPLPIARVALDLLMIGIFLLPSVRNAFRPPRTELRLRS